MVNYLEGTEPKKALEALFIENSILKAKLEKQEGDIKFYKECIKGLENYIIEIEKFYSTEGDDLR